MKFMNLKIAVMGINLFPGALLTYPNRYIHDLHVGINANIHYITNGYVDKTFEYRDIVIHMVSSSFYLKFEDFKRKLISINPDIVVLFGTFFNLLHFYRLKDVPAKKVFFPCFSKYSFLYILKQYNKFSYYTHHLLPLKGKVLKEYIDLVVCPSNNIKRIVLNELGKKYYDKIVCVRPGIKKENITIPKKNYFSYFGDANKDRGIEEIIYAAKKLPEINFRLYIRSFEVEDKNKRSYIEIQKLASNLDNVEVITKNLSNESVKRSMAQSLAILLPFRKYYPTEVPYTVLESLSVGTFVITTPVNGIPEIIDDGVNGILCSPKKYGVLEAIKKFYTYHVDKSVTKGDLSVEYSLEKNRKKLQQLYRKVLD